MKRRLLVLPALLVACAVQALPENGAVRVERLAALCRVWGAVGWLHPRLAAGDAEWDAALLAALARVDAASSPEQFHRAVDSMLARLHDPATRVLPGGTAAVAAEAAAPSLRWTNESEAVLTVPDPRYFIASNARVQRLEEMFDAVRGARVLTLDLRGAACDADGIDGVLQRAFAGLLGELIASISRRDFSEARVRYRLQSGYVPDEGGTSGDYFSSTVTRGGRSFAAGHGPGKPLRMTILTDGRPVHLMPLLGGLRAAGVARVIHAGGAVSGGGPEIVQRIAGMAVRVRVGELVDEEGSGRFHARTSAAAPAGAAGDAGTPVDAYPDRGRRLLALFRFWNVIEYFFPYKPLMDRPWEVLLREYIPRVEAAPDALTYHLAMAELAAALGDSHVVVSSTPLDGYFGVRSPPLQVRQVEGRTAVSAVWGGASAAAGIRVGDVLTSIDGEPVAARRERLRPYLAASTPQSLEFKLDRMLLLGAPDSVATIGFERPGSAFTARLTRSGTPLPAAAGLPYAVLPGGSGYFDLTRLTPLDLDAAFDAVQDAPGLILDMRGYPRGVFVDLASRLAARPAVAAIFLRPEFHATRFPASSGLRFTQEVIPAGAPPYSGTVVMLIDESAISQSEHTALFVEAATDVTFIGSATQGADGDVTSVDLPGGLSVRFSGQEVRHGDGRQLQRVGIQPHIRVSPTLAGIAAGRDEVLERALEYLSGAHADPTSLPGP